MMDKKKRMVLIAAFGVLIAAAVYRFLPAVGGLGPSDDALLLKGKELQKLKRVVDERPGLESRLVSLTRELRKGEAELLSGDTPALAAVDIQNILTGIAGEIGVEVKTMRILRTAKETDSPYLGIQVQIQVGCSIDQLKDFLYKIESSQRYLGVTALRISVRRLGKSKGSIFSSLTVEGIMKKGIVKNGMKNRRAQA
jgi:hypothetical protein